MPVPTTHLRSLTEYILLLIPFPLLFFGCGPADSGVRDALCISNVSIIDVEQELRKNMTVFVKDGRIIAVEPAADISPHASNTIINGEGKFLIPGLWDAHVHFDYTEELAPRMFDLFLGYGITSVRDTGGRLGKVKAWRDKALENPETSPRVMIAGPLLDGMPNVYDGSAPNRPPLSVGSGSVEEVLNILDTVRAAGADFLKAYEMLTPAQLLAVTAAADSLGLKVTGHIPLSMDAISASNAGMDCMEHLRNIELSCATNADELLAQRRKMLAMGAEDAGGVLRTRIHQAQRSTAIANQDSAKTAAVLAVLAQNGTWQVPTLALNTFVRRKYFTRPDWAASVAHLPDSLSQSWLKRMEELAQRTFPESLAEQGDWSMQMIRPLHEAGVELMAGTDCPIAYLTPGYSLHEELAVLVEAGLTPLAALNAATYNPARFFGLENELGLVKENYLADLLLLDANPLEDIRNTTHINGVVRAGRYYSRSELDAMLAGTSKK